MVNQENMQRWVDALRSGEYTQIRGALENLAGNCAEGVACREAIKAGVPIRVSRNEMVRTTVFDCSDQNMPASVRKWLGLDAGFPRVTSPRRHETASVVVANDGWKWSFAEIADALYAQYLKEPDNG